MRTSQQARSGLLLFSSALFPNKSYLSYNGWYDCSTLAGPNRSPDHPLHPPRFGPYHSPTCLTMTDDGWAKQFTRTYVRTSCQIHKLILKVPCSFFCILAHRFLRKQERLTSHSAIPRVICQHFRQRVIRNKQNCLSWIMRKLAEKRCATAE